MTVTQQALSAKEFSKPLLPEPHQLLALSVVHVFGSFITHWINVITAERDDYNGV